ncbi:MAG: hypothetical protein WEA31_04540, partial [Pirellulales bacterium]
MLLHHHRPHEAVDFNPERKLARMRYFFLPVLVWLALCLMFGGAAASHALAQVSLEPAADREKAPWQAAPHALPPATTAGAEPLGRLPPAGETLPRAELDAN